MLLEPHHQIFAWGTICFMKPRLADGAHSVLGSTPPAASA